MFLYKFILYIAIFCILQTCCNSYVYPLWTYEDRKPERLTVDSDATVTEFVVMNLVLPCRDGLCNVCANFLEVYTCIMRKWQYLGEKIPQESPTYLQKVLSLLGIKTKRMNHPPQCSYYSILVVTTTLVLFVSLLVVTKKLVEYVKEDDGVFQNILPEYKSRCSCYQDED